MLTETFHSITGATRNVLGNWKSMLLIGAVYASLLAVLYLFVSIKEATLAQVTLTFVFAVAVPLLFFVLQAMIASGHPGFVGPRPAVPLAAAASPAFVLKRSLASFWKLIVITLPLIALAVLIAYLLSKAQNRFGANLTDLANSTHRLEEVVNRTKPAPRPIDWRTALFSTLRYLCFGLVLPLAAIHLWLATVRDGLGAAIRRLATVLARAFSPQSVLIYIVGFLIFAVAPYFLLFRTTQTKHAWLELSLLVVRLIVVYALTLFGWTITVRALAAAPRAEAREAEARP
ncbi:MAG TPA: hypothetical protein VIW64_18105 [Pyrinomonadaceae bacterium]|jgi:hypothetical protein